jgi:peptide/nickel transport system ATP-binding protein
MAAAPSISDPAVTLAIEGLSIDYQSRRGSVQAARDISFELRRGEAMALIGESGSGKTTLGLGMIRLLASAAKIRQGRMIYRRYASRSDGGRLVKEIDILGLNPSALRQFRWKECAMVFQGALNAFNPVLKISDQFADTARAHGAAGGKALRDRSMQLLEMVRLDASRVWNSYPHELSGGMRQRVLIALALLLEPQLLILDEPTTALDILTQRNIMDVLKELRTRLDFSLIFISHDLSLAAELADRVATVYAGRIVEIGDVYTLFKNPQHPYTIGLINAVPTLAGRKEDLTSIPGSPPDLIDMPSGCKFHPRCPLTNLRCQKEEPETVEPEPGHRIACWKWQESRNAVRGFQAS